MAAKEPSETATVDATAVLPAAEGMGAGLLVARTELVLAFGRDGKRGPEFREIRRRKLDVGRGSDAFEGGSLDDPRMSREHFTVRRRGENWVVQDPGSRNGTRVDGEQVEKEAPIAAGGIIRAGDTIFVLTKREMVDDGGDIELIGRSEAALRLRKTIRAVAPHPATVLLTGETGTGKEVAARMLHRLSGRRGEFVAVNCGAFSEGMLESELFGHRKGAFTGAVDHNTGLFRTADGGTLFLDEVGEMPAALQVKLLRVLESQAVRPVGGTKDILVDVRVVAATNRDLVAEVQSGRFRSDLYARLSQWLVPLPPLRERREDVPMLVRHTLLVRGAPDRGLRPDLAETLMLHRWPLNVRGLINVVSMALIASGDGPLELGPEVRNAIDAARSIDQRPAETAAPDPSGLRSTIPSSPRVLPPDEQIEAALRFNKGRVAASARELGLSRQQVYRWLEANERQIDDFRGE